jgi:hypothetical protein
MNPFGVLQLALVALEGVAYAVNPKLKKEAKRRAVGFGIAYVLILLGGVLVLVLAVRSLYSQK